MSTHETLTVTRRGFVSGTGALMLGVGFAGCASDGGDAPQLMNASEATVKPGSDVPPFAPDAFIRISTDDTVTVISKHAEMGQGPYTGLATLIADELDADWAQIRVEAAPADREAYKNLWMGAQGTGGSTAIGNSYYQMRTAGAAARQMLVETAAERWQVEASEIRVSRGLVVHLDSGRSARFGELVEAASQRPVPAKPRLKDPSEFVMIGREMPRIDSEAKTTGEAIFGIDHYREGMLTVVIERPPKFGAKVASVDPTAAEQTPGVVAVRELPEGVAVYAEDTWSALKGKRALIVEWDDSRAETRSTEELFAMVRAQAKSPGIEAARKGEAVRKLDTLAASDEVFVAEAEYAFPHLAHAGMEPLDAVIERDVDAEGNGDGVVVTYGCQGPTRDHAALAATLGLPLEKVRIETQMMGGGFGRRSQHDSHFPNEVAHVFTAQPGAPETRRPIKVMWTREDDIRGGYYRPMIVHRVRGAMDRDGRLLAWNQHIAGQSFMPESRRKDGIDFTMVEGADNLAYATDDLLVTQKIVPIGVPVLWWRSVGHTHTGHAVESFIDELLEGTRRDPVEGRLSLLGNHPRHTAALTRAAEMADWGRTPAEGRAFGVAVHESFRSVVAQIVEIEAVESPVHRPRVKRVWCAVDCGVAVNPNVVRAQMEGGIGFGLGAALYSEINLEPGGRVREGNFDRYRTLRIDDMPEVEVGIVPSQADPTGVGEPGVPPISPAVANAWRRLTGKRVSRLPFVRNA